MPMNRLVSVAAGLLLGAALPAVSAARQAAPAAQPAAEALRVFLDCNAFCDGEYLRREITYVNWMRDRADADVHLLITSQSTGGGGQQYNLKYIGLKTFQGSDDEIRFATHQGDTDDEVRKQLTQRISLGLARYVARGTFADRLTVTYKAPEGAGTTTQKPHDPWNLWVYTVGVNGNLFGESQNKFNSVSGSLSARRVTETWKFRGSFRGSHNHSENTLSDSTVFKSTTSNYNLSTLLVRSLGEHWSFGIDASAMRSTVDNFDLSTKVMSGIEFDVYPYKESSKRQFVLVYSAGMSYANYRDTTIFNRLKETRPLHSLTAALSATQPWGSVNASLTGSNYLNDWSKNRLSISTGCSIRIVRGLQLDLFGGYSRVRDQLSLEKAGISDEERLLRLKQLKTSYFYNAFMGLSYTFGSKFNNIVNPRFESTSGSNCFCGGGSCFCN
jgi:hypothetical protein